MIQRALLALAGSLLAFQLHAQTVTLGNGAVVSPLVTLPAGHAVGGLDVDSAGDLFYLDVDSTGGATHLYERTPAGVKTDLYDIATSSIYGVFVRVNAGSAYLSYATFSGTCSFVSGTVGASGQMLQNPHTLTLAPGAYDLAFNPAGTAFLSSNPNGFSRGNHVYLFDPISGAEISKVLIPNDYSGPLAFNPGGDLLYGTTVGNIDPGEGVYKVSA